MSNVTQYKTCKNCLMDVSNLNLAEKIPEGGRNIYCPYCRHPLENATNKRFDSPDYLLHQRDTLLKLLKDNNIIPGSSRHNSEIELISDDLIVWARTAPTEDRIAALWDSVTYLRELVHSNTDNKSIETIIKLGKKIGELSVALDSYVKSGGVIYDRKTRPIRSEFGESDWDQAAAAQGRDS